VLSVPKSNNGGPAPDSAPVIVYDPTRPITHGPSRTARRAPAPGQNQRHRRSVILATIRRLLLEEGCEKVTVRRIAECSGHAVQTIYNLVGPRDAAITEAINEYCQYIGLTAMPDPDNPSAAAEKFDHELKSIEANPEYCRKVCLIFFSESRHIFYNFRDRQIRYMNSFLMRQKRCGIIRPDVKSYDLAQQVILFTSALCVEWSDRPFPLNLLQRRLYAGYANLLSGAISARGDQLHLALMANCCRALH
jgi:hypothetical protein